ncbi:hypothetical protein BLOT_014255 [Blomia tropicalis]|nr:hypothetical protein BLOT_014255 [Blomia tropicalis]
MLMTDPKSKITIFTFVYTSSAINVERLRNSIVMQVKNKDGQYEFENEKLKILNLTSHFKLSNF